MNASVGYCSMLFVCFIAGFQKSSTSTVSDHLSLRYIVIDGSNVAMR